MRSNIRVAKPQVESIEELREICQKGKTTSFTDEIERRTSIYVTRLLLHTGLTANQATWLDILIGVIACVFFFVGRPWYAFAGAILLGIWRYLDCVDGEIARYRGSSSISGIYLDRLNHMLVEPLVFVSISFGLFQAFPNIGIFALGFSAALSRLLMLLARASVEVSIIEAIFDSNHSSIKVGGPNSKMGGYAAYLKSVVPVSRSSILFQIASFVYFTGKIYMIIIASAVDILIPAIRIGEFVFNSMYIFLIVFGIFSHFLWIGTVFLILNNRSCEKLYFLLLKELARTTDWMSTFE